MNAIEFGITLLTGIGVGVWASQLWELWRERRKRHDS